MKFGHYYDTSAANLREFNRKAGGGDYCVNCHSENAVRAIYRGFICNDSSAGLSIKARGYMWQCRFCGCTYDEPFKIYFNQDVDD